MSLRNEIFLNLVIQPLNQRSDILNSWYQKQGLNFSPDTFQLLSEEIALQAFLAAWPPSLLTRKLNRQSSFSQLSWRQAMIGMNDIQMGQERFAILPIFNTHRNQVEVLQAWAESAYAPDWYVFVRLDQEEVKAALDCLEQNETDFSLSTEILGTCSREQLLEKAWPAGTLLRLNLHELIHWEDFQSLHGDLCSKNSLQEKYADFKKQLLNGQLPEDFCSEIGELPPNELRTILQEEELASAYLQAKSAFQSWLQRDIKQDKFEIPLFLQLLSHLPKFSQEVVNAPLAAANAPLIAEHIKILSTFPDSKIRIEGRNFRNANVLQEGNHIYMQFEYLPQPSEIRLLCIRKTGADIKSPEDLNINLQNETFKRACVLSDPVQTDENGTAKLQIANFAAWAFQPEEDQIFLLIMRPSGELAKRPLHFIWLADCSGSMSGSKIQSLNTAIREVIPYMRDFADNNLHVEVLVRAISFDSKAVWHIPQPTPVHQFQWKDLSVGGVTAMGAALKLLAQELDVAKMPSRSLPPVLILLSDGEPTDNFKEGLKALLDQPWGMKAVRISIAIGQDADMTVLQEFIGHPEIKPLQADNSADLLHYIRWASTEVLQAASAPPSKTTQQGPSTMNVPLTPPPPPPPSAGPASAMDKW